MHLTASHQAQTFLGLGYEFFSHMKIRDHVKHIKHILLISFRFIENGVWDLVDVAAKQVSTKYICCEFLYYNLEYRLVFQRQAAFYVTYLIVPVILLSTLAVAVFFLPPDCGAKLQFSITNLLALSFFQKLVAELIPPAGEDTPIIGKFGLVETFYCKVLFVMMLLISISLYISLCYAFKPSP